MGVEHYPSTAAVRPRLRELWASQETIGSVHTLGALHEAHGQVISHAAKENRHVIVTVYPNRIQLFPGSVYEYDLAADIALAESHGATLVISSDDAEMYPPDYATYIDQGERARRLNSSVFDFASRGQVTGAVRWISLCRPTKSYFGMKDIEQSLLVRRAVADLLIDCEIREVPCVRLRDSKAPVSSRLRSLDGDRLSEVGSLYDALEGARQLIASGQRDAHAVTTAMGTHLAERLSTFRVLYTAVVDAETFAPLARVRLPCVLHIAITDGVITHFDGLCLRTEDELENSTEVIWIP
jgi:pantoate--beta-alanine ligase